MKVDIPKDSYTREKHFEGVVFLQGRPLLASELNEQTSINAHRTETGVRDIIGKSGTPSDKSNPAGGFQISPANENADVNISKGHYYVDGILCENENDVLFANQPDLILEQLPTTKVNGDGDYLFYLDVWHRHITVLEDSAIREVALGGPDTTARIKTVWQVKWKGPAAVNCANALDGQITDSPTGKLMARTKSPESSSDPCGLAESGGYTRLENQLYRVEIHIGGGNHAVTTFKWSRDNATVVAKWESQDSANKGKLVVSTTGRDDRLSFKEGDWIEIIDDRTDLLGIPGILVELQHVEGNTLIINSSTIKDPDHSDTDKVSILERINPRIRKWDSVADIKLNSATWISLEDGVEVKFDGGTFKTGDYWLIPARTAIADIEWPYTVSQLPFGVKHHYALLGILKLKEGQWSVVSDCRPRFPSLTDLTSLFYESGGGRKADQTENCCCVTVGIRGEYDTIDKAFVALDGEEEICLCLLPGIHDVVNIQSKVHKKSIKITGCNSRILVSSSDAMNLKADIITLQDVEILAGAEINPTVSFSANEVNIDHCTFIHPIRAELPFVLIRPLDEAPENYALLRFTNNIMRSDELMKPDPSRVGGASALALCNGVMGWLEDNIIMLGDVLLQYDYTGKNNNSINWTTSEYDYFIKNPEEIVLINHSPFINLRGNKFLNVQTFAPVILNTRAPISRHPVKRQYNSYGTITVSENEFSNVGNSELLFNNSFIADRLIFNANLFDIQGSKKDIIVIVARVVGDRGIFIGNMAGGQNSIIQTILITPKEASANMLTIV